MVISVANWTNKRGQVNQAQGIVGCGFFRPSQQFSYFGHRKSGL